MGAVKKIKGEIMSDREIIDVRRDIKKKLLNKIYKLIEIANQIDDLERLGKMFMEIDSVNS